jgi:biopolymer transport protein ExbD
MSMSVGGGGEGDPMMDINTTPLIDVMLVLLIMFIVTIPVMTHAVKLDMPRPRPEQAEPPPPSEVIDLKIEYDGAVYWNDTPVSDFATLENYFRSEALALAQRQGINKIGFVGMEQFAD